MLLVVLGHVSAMPKDLILWAYAFHMPLFFMISGMVFRYEKYASARACVIDKAKKLLAPYAMLFIINIPLWYVNRKIFGHSSATPMDMLIGFITANSNLGAMSSGALWFLPTLFLVSILFWGLVHLDRQKKFKIEAGMILCFLAAWFLSSFYDEPTAWRWATVPMATVFYWIGYSFGQCWQRCEAMLERLHNPAATFSGIAIGLLAVGTWIAFLNGKISMAGNSYHDIALMLASSLCLSLGMAMLFMKLPTLRLFDYAGKNSIIFFGFHIAVLRFLENFPYTADFAADHALWTTAIVFLALVPISMFVNRFCPFIVAKKRQKKTG